MSTSIADENPFELFPDDGVFALMEWLTLDDLCAISRTCKRLQMLGQQHFRRKFPVEANTQVKVTICANGEISVSPRQNYVKCFQQFITNISIASYEHNLQHSADQRMRLLILVAKFMERKCNQIRTIRIVGDIDLNAFGNICAEMLHSVETVVLIDLYESGVSVDETRFLTYFPNVTTLIMENGIDTRSIGIFQQKYRILEHFYYIKSCGPDSQIDGLTIFFRNHPNIETVALKFAYNDAADNALKCLQMVEYATNLKHMFLHIDKFLADNFDTICNFLSVLCSGPNFQCLEIDFEGEKGAAALKANSNLLTNLKQCTKIHVTCMRLTEIIPTLQSLTHLRTLVLTDVKTIDGWNFCFNLRDLVQLVDKTKNIDLPFLEEVYLVDGDQVVHSLLQFVSHCSGLKRIFIPACNWLSTGLLATLSKQRKKLRNACELTIFTDQTGNITDVAHDLVQMEFVKFNRHPFKKYALKYAVA